MFLLGMMLLPWMSVPFIKKQTFRHFLPGALFICVWVAVESVIANKRAWWRFYEKLFPNVLGELPLIIGPLFVGSLWILKFTWGKFRRYFLVNFIVDIMFVYPGIFLLKKMGIVSLVRLKHYQLLLIFLTKSVLMYGFQGLAGKFQRKPSRKYYVKKYFKL
jgi:hypothetical protein